MNTTEEKSLLETFKVDPAGTFNASETTENQAAGAVVSNVHATSNCEKLNRKQSQGTDS